ncbi:hypothetical protein [Ruegeria sp. HKCCD4318-2]|uniref:hypothetical protein n=1 Tax=Ruegeria sp. HKCCD4318-2 TaxID=2683020 RepID=UPI001C1098A3|nr:hypothetical protein [Ruegeria sp. HKCCD4318-2]
MLQGAAHNAQSYTDKGILRCQRQRKNRKNGALKLDVLSDPRLLPLPASTPDIVAISSAHTIWRMNTYKVNALFPPFLKSFLLT